MMLEAALRYAGYGYPVFQCAPNGKTPLGGNGHLDATTDLDLITEWWTATPNANIGISTTGLLVVDIDGEDNPWPGYGCDDLGVGAAARSPNNGRHFWFRQPAGAAWRSTASQLANRVDTRANGGYVVVAPSRLPNGIYSWVDDASLFDFDGLPLPPQWLITALSPANRQVVPSTPDGNVIIQGSRNTALARMAGVMRRAGMTQGGIEAALMAENQRCSPPLPRDEVVRICTSIGRYAPDDIAVAIVEDHFSQDGIEIEDQFAVEDPGPCPEHLLSIPGFVNSVMAHTIATAHYPNRALAFGGAIAIQALLAGRKVCDPYGTRVNLYVVALANSGVGKDHPRKINRQIMSKIGEGKWVADLIASMEGLEDRLHAVPSMLFQTDEFDHFLLQISKGKEIRYEQIMASLMRFFTTASSTYSMRAKVGMDSLEIVNPNLCLFATAIPKNFYESLNAKVMSNGGLSRMLILEAGNRGQRGSGRHVDIPDDIIETAAYWKALGGTQGNLAQEFPVPLVVSITPEANDIINQSRDYADEQYQVAESAQDDTRMSIWSRVGEKVHKLALLHACSADFRNPIIDVAAATWATQFADYQTRKMLSSLSKHMVDGEHGQRCKKAIEILLAWQSEHGDTFMPRHSFLRKMGTFKPKEIEDVLGTLKSQHKIEDMRKEAGPRGGRGFRGLRITPRLLSAPIAIEPPTDENQ